MSVNVFLGRKQNDFFKQILLNFQRTAILLLIFKGFLILSHGRTLGELKKFILKNGSFSLAFSWVLLKCGNYKVAF